ncbi:transposase family protein [Streptomyces europaeiscabiei]|uniref:transposase family protein n=1 Tax=Streptomyces europaeiscabiei TaxID=146819 RepID=UPI003999D259
MAALSTAGGGLLECFAEIADPRSWRGIRHSVPTILGLCTAAVLSGNVTSAEVTDFVAGAAQELPAALTAEPVALTALASHHLQKTPVLCPRLMVGNSGCRTHPSATPDF